MHSRMSDTRYSRLAEQILARKPHRVAVPPPEGQSFRWHELDFPARTGRLTVHPEYEVQLIRSGYGQVIIGDRARAYAPGHIALIGSDVPHAVIPRDPEPVPSASAVVHFSGAWLEGLDRVMPELRSVVRVLTESKRGIILVGESARRATHDIESMGTSSGAARLAHLVALLGTFAAAPGADRAYVASSLFRVSADPLDAQAADVGLSYIIDNLATDLSVAGAAIAARMSESTFSKHFKQATGATFTETVRSLRIAHAQRLLERTDEAISVIAERAGYNNLSNFNRQFRAVVGVAPAVYRRRTRGRD